MIFRFKTIFIFSLVIVVSMGFYLYTKDFPIEQVIIEKDIDVLQ